MSWMGITTMSWVSAEAARENGRLSYLLVVAFCWHLCLLRYKIRLPFILFDRRHRHHHDQDHFSSDQIRWWSNKQIDIWGQRVSKQALL